MSEDTRTRSESQLWADASRSLDERVDVPLGEATLDEKLAEPGSVRVGADLGRGNVAPMQEAFAEPAPREEAGAYDARLTGFTTFDATVHPTAAPRRRGAGPPIRRQSSG